MSTQGCNRQFQAGAKINLTLHVMGRRADGYHDIDSYVVPLVWGDDVSVAISASDRTVVTCDCEPAIDCPPERNLAYRAAVAALSRLQLHARVEIRIHKRIWSAAGLGGGSSDAACVLRAVLAWADEQCDGAAARLTPGDTQALALSLGADVPVLLDGSCARMRGIGERIERIAAQPRWTAVLANPRVPLSTADVYGGLALAPGQVHRDAIPHAIDITDPDPAQLANDLQPVAERLCPAVGQLCHGLRAQGARVAQMSGSGATVFGLFHDAESATAAVAELARRFPTTAFQITEPTSGATPDRSRAG